MQLVKPATRLQITLHITSGKDSMFGRMIDRTLHTSMVLVWLVDPMCGVHQSVEVRYIIRLNIYVVLYIVCSL
jgi:hypothetical protein